MWRMARCESWRGEGCVIDAIAVLPSLSPGEKKSAPLVSLGGGVSDFRRAARNVGRWLQGNLSMAQLTRRMRENWVDRSTMDKALNVSCVPWCSEVS